MLINPTLVITALLQSWRQWRDPRIFQYQPLEMEKKQPLGHSHKTLEEIFQYQYKMHQWWKTLWTTMSIQVAYIWCGLHICNIFHFFSSVMHTLSHDFPHQSQLQEMKIQASQLISKGRNAEYLPASICIKSILQSNDWDNSIVLMEGIISCLPHKVDKLLEGWIPGEEDGREKPSVC